MWFVKLLLLRLLLWNNKPKREKGKKRKEKPLSLSLYLSLFLSINYACEKFLFLLPNLISQRDSLSLYLEFSRGSFFRALILLCFLFMFLLIFNIEALFSSIVYGFFYLYFGQFRCFCVALFFRNRIVVGCLERALIVM